MWRWMISADIAMLFDGTYQRRIWPGVDWPVRRDLPLGSSGNQTVHHLGGVRAKQTIDVRR